MQTPAGKAQKIGISWTHCVWLLIAYNAARIRGVRGVNKSKYPLHRFIPCTSPVSTQGIGVYSLRLINHNVFTSKYRLIMYIAVTFNYVSGSISNVLISGDFKSSCFR